MGRLKLKTKSEVTMQNFSSLFDIMLLTVYVNNNYIGCLLRIKSVKDERLLIKININDSFTTRLRVLV